MAGTLHIVSTPIGNLGDISYRAVEVLRGSELILAEDTRRVRVLLERYDIAPSNLKSYHKHNEAARTEEVCDVLAAGGSVALVSDSGTPLISDPGLRLVRAAIALEAAVVPLPGPSAVLAALVGSGLEAQPFTFLGFLPRTGKARRQAIEGLAGLTHTAVIFESPQRLVKTLDELAESLGADRSVVVARELTKIHEEFVRGTLTRVAAYYREQPPRGEIVLCLGGALGESADESMEDARVAARRLAQDGAKSKEIVRELRARFGLDRNRAYAIALEVAEEETAG